MIAHERSTLNTSRAPILQATDDICERVEKIRARWLPPEIFGSQTVAGQQEALQASERQLAGLARRIKADSSAVRIPDILEESAEYGMDLLRLSSIGIGIGDSEQRDLIWQIGERLRELQTRRRYHDGGQSDQRIRNDLIQANDDLQASLATIL